MCPGNIAAKILEPSRGGTGIILNTARITFMITPQAQTSEISPKCILEIRLKKKAAKMFDKGPAAPTSPMPFLGFLKW